MLHTTFALGPNYNQPQLGSKLNLNQFEMLLRFSNTSFTESHTTACIVDLLQRFLHIATST